MTMMYAETAQDQSWRLDAACSALPPSWFFPVQPGGTRTFGSHAKKAIAKAQRICAACPVRHECLDYAVEAGEQEGIWGGILFRHSRPLEGLLLSGSAY